MAAPAWTFRHHWMAHTATHALMRPDKPALRYRGESTTWAQLSRRSLQVAAGLAAGGVGEGDRVAILTLNHPWFVETVFGANSLGAMAVPLNFRLAPPELDYILGDCTPAAIFVDAPLAPLLAATPNAANIPTVVVIGDAELTGGAGSIEAEMGGMGESGLGRRHGAEGIRKFTDNQTIATQTVMPLGPPGKMTVEGFVGFTNRQLGLFRRLRVR